MRCLATLALLVLSSCAFSIGSPDVWVESGEVHEPTSSVTKLRCESHNGSIHVAGGASSVRVDVEKRAGGDDDIDAAACLANIEVIVEERGEELYVGWRWREDPPSNWVGAVSFAIDVPSGWPLTLKSHNGEIVTARTEAPVTANCHNGAISVSDASGPLTLETHNGSVRVRGGTPDQINLVTHNGALDIDIDTIGPITGRIETHNGSVDLFTDSGASCRVRAETHNGSIDIDDAWDDIRILDDTATARRGSGDTDLVLTTHNGKISIR